MGICGNQMSCTRLLNWLEPVFLSVQYLSWAPDVDGSDREGPKMDRYPGIRRDDCPRRAGRDWMCLELRNVLGGNSR